MGQHSFVRCFALLLVLGAGGVAHGQKSRGGSARGRPEAEAKQRFEQAVADYDAGRYDQALANFQEAFRLGRIRS